MLSENMIKVAFCSYFWNSSDDARKVLSKQVPNEEYTWGSITAVTEDDDPDYYVLFQEDTKHTRNIPAEKKIFLQREPVDVQSVKSFKEKNNGYLQMYDTSYQFSKWWVDQSYDELAAAKFPVKSRMINAVLSNKRGLEGHKLRSDFVLDYMQKYPNELDLFGSLSKTYKMLLRIRKIPGLEKIYSLYLRLPFVKVFVDFDKFTVTLPYSYSFVAENSQHDNYFTEKIVDAYLSWSMPIYWGCPNIGKYFPEDSYHTIDIHHPDALERMHTICNTPLTQKNIEAIAEARKLILDKYNLWPALESYIKNNIHKHE